MPIYEYKCRKCGEVAEAFIQDQAKAVRCPYYMLVDADHGKIDNVQAIQSPFYGGHGEGDVPNFIQAQGAKVMISGGMGPKAIGYFNQFGIEMATGAGGKVGDAVKNYLDGGSMEVHPVKGMISLD